MSLSMVLLSVLVLTLSVGLVQSCPRSCNCYQTSEVHCTFRSLLSVPTGLPPHTRRINLGFNNINKLHNSSFSGLKKVELLMLHSNDLHQIPAAVFKDMKSLQILKLSYNKLRELWSPHTFSGLTSVLRLYLDHNLLQFIHPRAFLQLPSLRLLRLQGNRLHQLHPQALCTVSLLNTYYFSTIRHLDLSNNSLSTLPSEVLETAPLLETLVLQSNPWSCDCGMNWLLSWTVAHPGLMKCPGGPQCPTCASPSSLHGQALLDQPSLSCTPPLISSPGRETPPLELPELPEIQSRQSFGPPLGTASLSLSDQQGYSVEISCNITHSGSSQDITSELSSFPSPSPLSLALSLSLECYAERDSYEKLWRIMAYYSETPVRLERELMLSKAPALAYRYRQAAETEGYYHTGVKASVRASPQWLLQPAISIQLNRARSNRKAVHLVASTRVSAHSDLTSQTSASHPWVLISTNHTVTGLSAVAGGKVELSCPILSSGDHKVEWVFPDGSKIISPSVSPNGKWKASSSGLLLQKLELSNAGLYYCVVSSGKNIDVLPLQLAIVESATPRGREFSVNGIIGQPINLPCNASGSPLPYTSWLLPEGNIVRRGSAVSGIRIEANGSLSLPSASLRDAGHYRCIAVNQYGGDSLSTQLELKPRQTPPLRTAFPRGPQSAAGRSTKIRAPLFDEGSGNGEEEEEEKPVRNRRPYLNRHSNQRRRGPGSNGPIQSNDRRNRFGNNRNRVTPNRQRIDPKKWADLLAKIRQKTNTANSSQTAEPIEGENAGEEEEEGSSVDDTTLLEEGLQPVYPMNTATKTQTNNEVEQSTLRSTVKEAITESYASTSYKTMSTSKPISTTTELFQTVSTQSAGSTTQEVLTTSKPILTDTEAVQKVVEPNEQEPSLSRPQQPNLSPSPRPSNPWNTRRRVGQRRRFFNRTRGRPLTPPRPLPNPINQDVTLTPDTSTVRVKTQSPTTTSPAPLTVSDHIRTSVSASSATTPLSSSSPMHTMTQSTTESTPLRYTSTPTTTKTHALKTYSPPGKHYNDIAPSKHDDNDTERNLFGLPRSFDTTTSAGAKITTAPSSVLEGVHSESLAGSGTSPSGATASGDALLAVSLISPVTTKPGEDATTAIFIPSSTVLSATAIPTTIYTTPISTTYPPTTSISVTPSTASSTTSLTTTTPTTSTLINKKVFNNYPTNPVTTSTTSTPTSTTTSTSTSTSTTTYINKFINNNANKLTANQITLLTTTRPKYVSLHNTKSTPAFIPTTTSTTTLSTSVLTKERPRIHSVDPRPKHIPGTPGQSRHYPDWRKPGIANSIPDLQGSRIHLSPPASLPASPRVPVPRSRPRIADPHIRTVSFPSESMAWLHCESQGEPKPTITWTKVSSGAVMSVHSRTQRFEVLPNGTLIIQSVQLQDRGTYICSAHSFMGRDRLLTTLEVWTRPPRMQLSSYRELTTHQGGTLTVDCRADGVPAPLLSWVLPDRSVLTPSPSSSPSNTRLTADTNGTLRLSAALPTDRGLYRCVASNSAGAASASVRIHVSSLPPVIHQLKDEILTLSPGMPVYAHCSARGAPTPAVRWKIPDGTFVRPSQFLHGNLFVLPNGTLHIRSIGAKDMGSYECAATNAVGADKRIVRVELAGNQATGNAIFSSSANKGRTQANLYPSNSLNATKITPPFPIEKPKIVSLPVSTNPAPKINAPVTASPPLLIKRTSAVPANDAKLTAVVGNSSNVRGGGVEGAVPVSPFSKARIVSTSPSITTVQYGDLMLLHCDVTGNPAPNIIWRTPNRKLVDMHFSFDRRVKVHPNGTLSALAVTEKDGGDYLCIARNKVADDYRLVRVSVVTTPAKIQHKQPVNHMVSLGKPLKVDCLASGHPDPSVRWSLPDGTMVNSVLQGADRRGRYRRLTVFDNGTLLVPAVGMGEEGEYTCYAENQGGLDTMKVKVKVMTLSPPTFKDNTDYRIVKVQLGTTAKLPCEAIGDATPSVNWLSPMNRVIPRTSGSGIYTERVVVMPSGTLEVRIAQKIDTGNYTCQASNSAGIRSKVVGLEVEVPNVIRNTFTNLPRNDNILNRPVTGITTHMGRSVISVGVSGASNVGFRTENYGRNNAGVNGNTLRESRNGESANNEVGNNARNTGDFATGNFDSRYRIISNNTRSYSPSQGVVVTVKQRVTKGQSVFLHCPSQGNPPPRLTWLLPGNGVLSAPYYGSRLTVHRNGTLELRSVRESDKGTLVCVVRGDRVETRMQVELEVAEEARNLAVNPLSNLRNLENYRNPITPKPPPRVPISHFLPPSRSVTSSEKVVSTKTAPLVSIINGESLRLSCSAPQSPKYSQGQLSWTLPSGKKLNNNEKSGLYSVQNDGTLIVQQTSVFDRGTYTCRFSGYDTSSVFEVTVPVIVVAYPPRITSGPPPVTYTRPGVAVELPCLAIATPRATITWEMPDMSQLSALGQARIYGNRYLSPQGSLVIQNPSSRDTGFYRCTAKNVIGEDKKATYLHVI